jgi:hypothetical protein
MQQAGTLGAVPSNWSIAETGDFNSDSHSDILWRDSSSGAVVIWFMNGVTISRSTTAGAVGQEWAIQGLNVD